MPTYMIPDNIIYYAYDSGGVIFNRFSEKEYTVGLCEIFVIEQLAHGTSCKELLEDIPEMRLDNILKTFLSYGIITDGKSERTNKTRKKIKTEASLCIKKDLISRTSATMLSSASLYAVFLAFIFFILTYIRNRNMPDLLFDSTLLNLKDPRIYIYGIIASFLAEIGHEAAHALTAIGYNAHISNVGISWKYAFPYCFVRIIGIRFLTKNEKLHIHLSGLIFNLICFFCSISINTTYFNTQNSISVFLYEFAYMNLCMVLINSICCIPIFDGYKVVTTLLDDKIRDHFKKLKPTDFVVIFALILCIVICSLFFLRIRKITYFLFIYLTVILINAFFGKRGLYKHFICFIMLSPLMGWSVVLFSGIVQSPIRRILSIIVYILIVYVLTPWLSTGFYFINTKRKGDS